MSALRREALALLAAGVPVMDVQVLSHRGSVPREAGTHMLVTRDAVLGTIGGGLATALREEAHREAALITFLVTLSGVAIAGVGSAFWGVVAGALALFVQQYRRPREAP